MNKQNLKNENEMDEIKSADKVAYTVKKPCYSGS